MARARTLTLKTQVEVTGTDKLTNLGKKMQKTGAVLSAAVTLPLLALGKVATDAASDLNESLNAMNVTFGESAEAITKIGETSAESLGLSQRAFNEAAVRFSAFATTVAGEGGDVAQVIDDITQRGSDFASVYNLEVADALALFQSGLAGETEPLRKFGIDLSAAAVEAHALATGISAGIGPLTEAEKVQARYSLLMEQTSKVQGDFAATSGEVAGQQKIAAAAAEEAAAALGQKLLPIKLKVIEVLGDAIEAWSNLPAPMQDAIVVFGLAAAALGPLLGIFGTLLRGLSGIITIAPRVGAAFTLMLGPIGLVIAAVSTLVALFATDFLGMRTRTEAGIDGLAIHFGELGDKVNELAEEFDTSFDDIKNLVAERMGETGESVEDAIRSVTRELRGVGPVVEDTAITWAEQMSAIQDSAYGTMLGPDGVVQTFETGVDAAAGELGELPQKGADELLANQFHLTDAVDQLIAFMDQALSPAEEVFQARMFLASQAAADGLASGNPLVVAKTQELIAAANAVLAQHGKAAFNYGFNFGKQYAAGIVNSLGLVVDAGRQLASSLRRTVAIESEPPDPNSPLHGITKWGGNLVKTYADGMLAALSSANSAGSALAAALVPTTGLALAPAVGGTSGTGVGTTIINNYYLQWDGEPPQARDEAEIIATLQRLSPLINGNLGLMLKVREVDCQTENIHLDVVGYGEPAAVSGVDDILPYASGRDIGLRRKDVYRFNLEGFVQGTGENPDERALSWRQQTDVLMAVMDFALDPGEVEVGPEPPARFPDASPYIGLTDNMILNARCVSMVRGPVLHHMSFQSWSFQMECIDSPPEWQPSGSS